MDALSISFPWNLFSDARIHVGGNFLKVKMGVNGDQLKYNTSAVPPQCHVSLHGARDHIPEEKPTRYGVANRKTR
uniref:Uncharacterized protein n=1 Tax=Physcomitrium patens TaxID=3218 RepID=A0A7I4D0R0_PHYPA